MRKYLYIGAGLLVGAIISLTTDARQPNVRVMTDANGYLITAAAAYTAPASQPTPINQIRLRVDASGNLLVTNGSGGGGTYIGGSIAATQVAFGAATANTIAGDADFVYDTTLNQLHLTGSTDIADPYSPLLIERFLAPGATHTVTNYSSLVENNVTPTADEVSTSASYNGSYSAAQSFGAFDIYAMYGGQSFVWGLGASGQTIASAYGFEGGVFNADANNITDAYGILGAIRNQGTGTITSGFALYALAPENSGGGTVGTAYGVWIADQTVTGGTTDYGFWYDGSPGSNCNANGVTRIDNRGSYAGYNPCFAKYAADDVNFERTLFRWGDTGIFGVDNRAYLGVEVGGTGTARPLNLIGANLSFTSTLTPAVTDTSANSCGTGTQTIVGNDNSGKVTIIGSAGTSCTVTFATAFLNAPGCSATNETTAALARATSATGTVILAGTFLQNDVIAYTCIGR